MKTLLLMRHAKSSWDNPELTDVQRPLNARGQREAPRMGELLRQQGFVPDHVVSSTAVRARTTAEMVAAECNCADRVIFVDELYHANVKEWSETIAAFSSEWNRVLCVGHNPGLEELIGALTGKYLRMPTAAIAQLTSDVTRWSEFVRRSDVALHEVWRPKDLAE